MRSGLLCLLCGCNQIFGSHAVTERDAPPPGEPRLLKMSLTRMNVDTTSGADPSMIVPTSSALPDAHVQVGLIGGALSDIEIDGEGNFNIPEADTGDNVFYRLVYTPPDGVPVEVQANVLEAHFVVSSLGRMDAVPAPGNARLPELFPPGGPNPTFNNLHVFSIGTFAARIAGQVQTLGGSTSDWFAGSTHPDAIASLSGVLAAPDSNKGDQIVVVDGMTGNPDVSGGFAVGTMTKFATDGTADLVFPNAWKTTGGSDMLKWDIPNTFLILNRFNRIAPTPQYTHDLEDGVGNAAPFIYGGVLPTTAIANFLEPGLGWVVVSNNPVNHWAQRGYGGMSVPLFLPLSKVVTGSAPVFRVFNGVDAPKFPTAVYARFSASTVVENVTFTSGFQSVGLADNGNGPSFDFSIGVAYTDTQRISLNGVDIWSQDSSARVISRDGANAIKLTYSVDSMVDDCVATIYRVDAGAAVPVRRYLSAEIPASVPIEIEQSVFDHTSHYAIGVACHKGLPNVAHNSQTKGYDWRTVSYPFTESMVYTYTFVVP